MPALLVAGGGLLALLGDAFWGVFAVAALGALFLDLVLSAKRDAISVPERFAKRSREYMMLGLVGAVAASIFLLN